MIVKSNRLFVSLFVTLFVAFLGISSADAAIRSVVSNEASKGSTQDNQSSCWAMGYRLGEKTTCPHLEVLTDKCSNTKSGVFFKKCACKPSLTDCKAPQVGDGEACSNGKFEKCKCPSEYKYTESNCTGGQVLGGNLCTINNVKNYTKCACPAGYKSCTAPQVGLGGSCTVNGSTTYEKCGCPSQYNSTCSANGAKNGSASCTENGVVKYPESSCNVPPKDEIDGNGGSNPVCPYEYRYYWNSNGAHSVPSSNSFQNAYRNTVTRDGGPCAFEGYGNSAIISVPAGKKYDGAVLRFWTTVVTNGELNTNYITFENRFNSNKVTYTFNDKVTVHGRINVQEAIVNSATFKKGLYGDHYCEYIEAIPGSTQWKILRKGACPASWYSNNEGGGDVVPPITCTYNNRYYWNANGSHTIPTSNNYRNPYSNNVSLSGGPCGFEGYGASSTITIPAGKAYAHVHLRFWQGGTVNNKLLVSERLKFEGWDSNKSAAAYNWTFNEPVTVNGVIQIRTDTNALGKVTFKKGLYGKHTCEWGVGGGSWRKSRSGACPADWYANSK